MIRIIGTSHIATESVEDVEHHIDDFDPDIVAVELDPRRLHALQTGQTGRAETPPLRFMQSVQQRLSRKTGVPPGGEQLHAVEAAEKRGLPVALIDQDIRVTIDRLRDISLTEKIKIAAFFLFAFLIPIGPDLDLEQVPDDNLVHELMIRTAISFPETYQVLVKERDQLMASRLAELEQEFGDVLAFVGAGHVKGIQDILQSGSY